MKKFLLIMLIICITGAFGTYNIGDVVDPADNISWTISGPIGHPDVGSSSNIFTKIWEEQAVMIFWGQTW